ncbi:hypothetical protein L2E82_33396 [Cichorium intybus]|uniref:Uncharacterized protein n=1 Tax=Cichorium intybus TaxID=13427 RepID=A0ACB9BK13_CICIN|nr:hypothetical protein L2E82_33396 [Cichorium intybus]
MPKSDLRLSSVYIGGLEPAGMGRARSVSGVGTTRKSRGVAPSTVHAGRSSGCIISDLECVSPGGSRQGDLSIGWKGLPGEDLPAAGEFGMHTGVLEDALAVARWHAIKSP